MLKMDLKTLLLLLQVLVLATAAGTKGASGNQWPQNPPQQSWPQTKGEPLGGWDDEVNNPRGGYPENNPQWKLEDSIPGVPGQSYPNFDKIPQTSFDCRKQIAPGYYADAETQCQVFHICQNDGRQNSFLCPTGTIFDQKTFVCDWWFNVNCAETLVHANRNGNLFKSPFIGIDGMKTSSYRSQGGGQGTRGHSPQPPVGIPTLDSQSKGENWPPQGQGQSQGQWQQGGQNKGGSMNVNQGFSRSANQGGHNKGGSMNVNQGVSRNVNQGVSRNVNQGGHNKGGSMNVNQGGSRNVNQGGSRNVNQGGHNKGGSRNVNQGGITGGQGWQNRSPVSMKGGQGGINPEINQKRSSGLGSNMGWQQHGNNPRSNQKGGSFHQGPMANNNPDWSQRGEMSYGNINNRNQFGQPGGHKGGEMGHGNINNRGPLGQPGGQKGGSMNQRRPNYQSNYNQKGENFGRPINSMGPNLGGHQSKGSDANSWSMRPQNFQASFQDRKGSGSDVWPSNHNVNTGPQVENYPTYSQNQLQGPNNDYKDHDYNLGQFGMNEMNNNWNNEGENYSQWNGNVDNNNMYDQNDGFQRRQVSESGQEWQSDANINKEISWQTNDSWRKNKEDIDYDYS